MRIAVACQGLDVAPRFARSSSFMCYRVDRGMFADCQNMPNLSFPPAQLAQVLKDLDVSVMIVNRIDPTSETALKAAGIEVQAGYTGTASAAARTKSWRHRKRFKRYAIAWHVESALGRFFRIYSLKQVT